MKKAPVTATVVVCNEERRLRACLKSLSFCDEIIVCDLGSEDGSVAIASELATQVIHAERVLIAEMILASIVKEARYDWIFRVDPDEVVDPALASLICDTLKTSPEDVCGYRVPFVYYFKDKKLIRTPWGGRKYIARVINRARVEWLPYVHRGISKRVGMRWDTIDGSDAAIVHHFWCDSYKQLIEKHSRYLKIEGEARYKTGERFRPSAFFLDSLRLLKNQVRPSAWRKDGPRGFILCSFFIWYETSAKLSLRRYQANLCQP